MVPTLAITAGDPLGIGPEVVVKALADGTLRRAARHVIYGHEATLAAAARRAGIGPFWSHVLPPGEPGVQLVHRGYSPAAGAAPGPTADGGRHAFDALACAIEACKRDVGDAGAAHALVTAPISKEAWRMAGIGYPGHTELLAHEFASPRSGMLFVGPRLRVILATIHVALGSVPRLLTTARVVECIQLGSEACRRLGAARARIAVAGLNPHAGEGGMFGDEDARIIAPAVAQARGEGHDVRGPLPGDTVFSQAAAGEFDLVVAMYHDQGLIPVKLIDRGRTVNATVGLRWTGRPVVRTSPAHGTAYDIAGKNLADPESMSAAMALALSMCGADRQGLGPAAMISMPGS